jgi:hypothetical protein
MFEPNVRYVCVTLRHAVSGDPVPLLGDTRDGSLIVPAAVTFRIVTHTVPSLNSLLEKMVDAAAPKLNGGGRGPLPQIARNRASLLRRVAKELEVPLGAPATALLGPGLEPALARLAALGLTAKTLSDLRSGLRWWNDHSADRLRMALQASDSEWQASPVRKREGFGQHLRQGIKRSGLTNQQVADQAQVAVADLRRWLRTDSAPHLGAAEAVGRVEAVLALEPGDLSRLLRPSRTPARERKPDAWGQYLTNMRQVSYILQPTEVSKAFHEEWGRLVEHHTAARPELKRSRRAGWRLKVIPKDQKRPLGWWETHRGKMCKTAGVIWARARSFLGWLRLDTEHGGWGVPLEDCLTLAWFAVPDAVEAYLEWQSGRAGQVNGGTRSMAELAHAYCSEKTGWLRQLPELAARLPSQYRPHDWNVACDHVLDVAKEWIDKEVFRSRDPNEALEYFYQHDDYATPILKTIEALEIEASACRRGSRDWALALRDAAILALMLISPLRQETLSQLRVGAGLHLRVDGRRLRAHIPKDIVKNGNSLGPIEIDIEADIVLTIGRYFDEARSVLIKDTPTNLAFVSSTDPGQIWNEISPRIKTVIARYCEGHGLPEHSFRHLVASRFLKQHPGEYVGVAALLHDSLPTVLKVYARKDPTCALDRNAASLRLG